MSEHRLDGKVAIVTGSSGGIGKGIAHVFAEAGAKTVLAARRKEVLEQYAGELRAKGWEAFPVAADVTREKDVANLFAETVKKYGRVDILINNAGMPSRTPTEDTTLDAWMEVINLNLTGPFLCAREAIRVMKKQGGGRIVNIGSISAIVPRQNSIAYATTKAGIEGMTRSLTLDGRAYGVVSSVIHPGATASSFNAARGGAGPGKRPEDYIMHPEDVGRLALLMCTLPPEVNIIDATILPNHMISFIGRG